MNTFTTKVLAIFCLMLATNTAFAQKAIKLKKQQTKFFYTQVNMHAGYNSEPDRLDFMNKGPKNQVAFQLVSKNKNLLQTGYVPLISLASYKVRFSMVYNDEVMDRNGDMSDVQLRILDSWVKFNTKWDRTSITVGNKTLPYGHNPKIDPVSSFMTNMISSDLGFGQDLGVFVKTPVSKSLDLEFAVTSGGLLTKPLLTCANLVEEGKAFSDNCHVRFGNIDYNQTWLMTGRVGQQSFRKNEFGLLVAAGYIPSTFFKGDYRYATRIGGDWVYKHREVFKIVNQISVGNNKTDQNGNFASLAIQNNVDFFMKGRFIVSLSHSMNMANDLKSNSEQKLRKNTVHNSLTYAFSPHTRFRVNQYYAYSNTADNDLWGVSLQFVTGFGKRP